MTGRWHSHMVKKGMVHITTRKADKHFTIQDNDDTQWTDIILRNFKISIESWMDLPYENRCNANIKQTE